MTRVLTAVECQVPLSADDNNAVLLVWPVCSRLFGEAAIPLLGIQHSSLSSSYRRIFSIVPFRLGDPWLLLLLLEKRRGRMVFPLPPSRLFFLCRGQAATGLGYLFQMQNGSLYAGRGRVWPHPLGSHDEFLSARDPTVTPHPVPVDRVVIMREDPTHVCPMSRYQQRLDDVVVAAAVVVIVVVHSCATVTVIRRMIRHIH